MSQVYKLPSGLNKDEIMHRYNSHDKLLDACKDAHLAASKITPHNWYHIKTMILTGLHTAIEATKPQAEKGA